mmetsp:Transcript_30329/g.93856  ORF Transcript_30329/g.93856 Transcript_30329/m.93856 type:complete len:639 (+) Transcript_30329:488-2404(+)
MKKLNTDQVYRQRKYNLLHEESEGYSKVMTLLSQVQKQPTSRHAAQSLLALVGGFDLDPNRVMDVVLGSLQDCSNCPSINLRLDLLEDLRLGTSLSQTLGFKFQIYSGLQTPETLCRLAGMLLSVGAVNMEALLPHLTPSLERIFENTKSHATATNEASRLFGVVSLSPGESATTKKDLTLRVPGNRISSQIDGILEALLWDRRWLLAEPMLSRLERAGSLPSINIAGCRAALLSMAHFTVGPLYSKLSPSLMCFAMRSSSEVSQRDVPGMDYAEISPQRLDGRDLSALPRLLEVLEPLCCHLHVGIASDTLLLTKLARVIRYLFKLKQMQLDAYGAAKRLLEYVVLPAVSNVTVNPGCVCEIWSAIKQLAYCERQSIYAAWRGRGIERGAIGSKHFAVAQAECKAGSDARRLLKRVANEKKNSKHVGRALAKIANSNPLVIFHIILSQVESYDNMIHPIIESLGFVTPLAMDVLSYVIPVHLADTSRQRLQDDGINIAHWFQHLAQFTGAFYRAFPQAELRALIDFLMLRLELGESLYLLVLNELLARMGGCEVLQDISDAQIGGLAGGETLRHEMLAFDKASKRAVFKLRDVLCTSSTAVPLLALIAQQLPVRDIHHPVYLDHPQAAWVCSFQGAG